MAKVTICAAKQAGSKVEMEFDFALGERRIIGLIIKDDVSANPPAFSSGETLHIERSELYALLAMLKETD